MPASSRRVRLAPDAQRDYDDVLLESFLTWGEVPMRTYRAPLDRALASLADFPNAGVRRDSIVVGCRVRVVEHHLLFYQIGTNEIEVVRILHERADARRHFRQRRP